MYVHIVFLASRRFIEIPTQYRHGDEILGIFSTATGAEQFMSGHIWEDFIFMIDWLVQDKYGLVAQSEEQPPV